MASYTSHEAQEKPISLRGSFGLKLPSYPYNPYVQGFYNAKSSGQHTSTTSAPKFAIQRNTDQTKPGYKKSWATIGREFLDEIRLKAQECHLILSDVWTDANGVDHKALDDEAQRQYLTAVLNIANRFLRDEQLLPEKEKNIKQINEADVVRCSTLYLVHPVAQAFWSHPDYSRTFVSQSEDAKDWSRTDLTFYKTRPGTTNRAFMILEYKRRTVIKRSEFEHSYDRPRSWPEGTQDFVGLNNLILTPHGHTNHQKAVDALKEVVKYNKANMDSPGASATNLFKSGGSLDLIKQASAYAIEHSTRYCALFDYETLVLCYFPWLDHTKQGGLQSTRDYYSKTDVQYPVEVEIVSGADIRYALLGFMRTAYDETPRI